MALQSKITFYETQFEAATFKLDDINSKQKSKERNLKYYRMHLAKQHNLLDPSSIAYCEYVEVELDAPYGDDKPEIYLQQWFMNQESKGLIITTGIDLIDADPETDNHRVICFDAQCFSLEDFVVDENTASKRRRIRLLIDAKVIMVAHRNSIVATYYHL